jgi:citrate lyase beta subunit
VTNSRNLTGLETSAAEARHEPSEPEIAEPKRIVAAFDSAAGAGTVAMEDKMAIYRTIARRSESLR